jgi:hypothetical protein
MYILRKCRAFILNYWIIVCFFYCISDRINVIRFTVISHVGKIFDGITFLRYNYITIHHGSFKRNQARCFEPARENVHACSFIDSSAFYGFKFSVTTFPCSVQCISSIGCRKGPLLLPILPELILPHPLFFPAFLFDDAYNIIKFLIPIGG